MTLSKGDRVSTPKGEGTVAYVRMGPPDYTKPISVSVVLDSVKSDPGYVSTMFLASQVTPKG